MQQPKVIWAMSVIDTINKNALIIPIKKRLGVKALMTIILNFDSDNIDKYDKMGALLLEDVIIIMC